MTRLLLVSVSLLALVGPLHAQSAANPRALAPGVQVELSGDKAVPPGTIDETALRHYARTGDVQRMEAEIARLKTLDPNWQPPKDLFSPPSAAGAGVDDSPIWALAAAGKLAEARAAAAEQRRKTPAWEPSAALAARLDQDDAVVRVRAASEAKRWREAVDAATPAVLTCANLDTMWRVAQAHGELKETAQAFDLYRTVVTTCPKAANRRDTVFKARPYLSPDQLRELTAAARTNPAPGEDYAALDRAGEELDVGATLDSLSTKGVRPASDKLERAAASVAARRDAGGALALGWYYQNARDYAQALAWFGRANEWTPSDTAAEGLVYANLGLKRLDAARAAAEPWLASSPRVAKALASSGKHKASPPVVQAPVPGPSTAAVPAPSLAPLAVPAAEPPPARSRARGAKPAEPAGGNAALAAALAANDWAGCLSIVASEPPSAASAQQKGWCLIELDRPAEAAQAFAEAKAQLAKAPEKDRAHLSEVISFGAMVTRVRRDDVNTVLRELPDSGLTPEHQRDLRVAALSQLALRAYAEKRYQDTLRFLDARAELATETRGLTLMRGWSLFNTQRKGESERLFEQLDRRLSDEDTRNALQTVRTKNGGVH